MPIYYHESSQTFHLFNNEISYIFKILKNNQLGQLYYGQYIQDREQFDHLLEIKPRPMSPCQFEDNLSFSLEHIKQEYPTYGHGDMRHPAIDITQENGSHILEFQYQTHIIQKGKPSLQHLPATYVEDDTEATTLTIILYDKIIKCQCILTYTIYENRPVITRHVKIQNQGQEKIIINQIMSMSLDLPDSDFEMLELTGAWSRERHIKTRKLEHGIQSIYSLRGHSSHHFNPFLALKRKNCDEYNGEVYAFSFVYSGNFLAQVEVDTYDVSRITMGIHPQGFCWPLEPGDSFQTPEVVMVYSSTGLNTMSQTFHQLYQQRLARGSYRDQVRPILINNWEATYMDFNEEKILKIATTAKELGIELFVLDDGWFGKRNADNSSLGDWTVNNEKINLKEVIDYAHSKDMKFGLWVEPEMISYDSDLYRAHPEFALFNRDHKPTLLRHQLVLDLTNDEVVDYVFDKLKNIFDNYPIDYCKWDFNRHLADIGTFDNNNEGEIYHRFILGTYKLLSKFKERYPHILLETCSAGGGRFDLGMLYYSPQIWCSDNTNPYSRVLIQYATNIFYPLSTIGSHVSADKALSIQDKAIVAAFGTFGYELDLSKLSEEDKAKIVEINKLIRDWHHIVTLGDYYAISSPFESNFSTFNIVSKEKKEALVFNFNFRPEQTKGRFIRVKGLDKNKNYFNSLTNDVYKGDFYMNVGINISAPIKEGMTMMFVLKEVNSLIKVVANKKAHAVKREKLM